jgi:hypothetical protein
MEYVSMAKWRERRWRLFSTFPLCASRLNPTEGQSEKQIREALKNFKDVKKREKREGIIFPGRGPG